MRHRATYRAPAFLAAVFAVVLDPKLRRGADANPNNQGHHYHFGWINHHSPPAHRADADAWRRRYNHGGAKSSRYALAPVASRSRRAGTGRLPAFHWWSLRPGGWRRLTQLRTPDVRNLWLVAILLARVSPPTWCSRSWRRVARRELRDQARLRRLGDRLDAVRIKRFGWVRDIPDQRDFRYQPPPRLARALPPKVDLRERLPALLQPGRARLVHRQRDRRRAAVPGDGRRARRRHSCLRASSSTTTSARSRARSTATRGRRSATASSRWPSAGFCSEELWPYDIRRFAAKPPDTLLSRGDEGSGERVPAARPRQRRCRC